MFYDQNGWAVRCEWGEQGVLQLAPLADAVVIVDVLSFTTCVDVALSRGADVLPYRWRDDSVDDFAARHGAIAASRRRRFEGGFSLSPTSLLQLEPGMKLVLPSPNGATLCALAQEMTEGQVYVACLRNAQTVGEHVARRHKRVLVVPAGERWPDGSLRPALEDWLGAGAAISAMSGTLSPEAHAATEAFHTAQPRLADVVNTCSSGRELIERGFEQDVALAAELGSSKILPQLMNGIFKNVAE